MQVERNQRYLTGILTGIAIICILLLAIGVVGTAIFHSLRITGERAWLNFSIAAIAIVVFFGFVIVERESMSESWTLRKPIAATIVVIYLVLVVTFSFYMLENTLSQISQMLLTSFTTVVSIVIAFYFGSSAYIEGKRARKSQKDTEE